jgi:hypothetical protein
MDRLPSVTARDETTDSTAEFVAHSRFGKATVMSSIPPRESDLWKTSFERHCYDHRYYELLHRTLGHQFEQRYLFLRDHSGTTLAIQPFFLVIQDLTAGLPLHVRKLLGLGRSLLPGFLRLRMLMVGSSAGESNLAVTEGSQALQISQFMHEVLPQVARHFNTSLIVLKDFPSRYRPVLQAFSQNGYTRIPSMPGATLDLSYSSFEDYMKKALSHATRKNLRRKFRDAARLPHIEMQPVKDISPYIDEAYPLYQQVLDRAETKFEEMPPRYFCELGTTMPDRARFFIWRQSGKIVAFSVCMAHNGVLKDTYIGLDYSIALDAHLYFLTWRDVVQWAIENKFKTYYSGPMNYDPKLHLRLRLAPLDLYVCHTSRWINPFFRSILGFLEPTRHDPIIRRFPNSHELWES